MSDTFAFTQYEISGGFGTATQQDGFDIHLSTTSGFTDELALLLAETLRNVPWPEGSGISTSSMSIFKSIQTTVTTSGNLTAAPPVFS